MGPLWKDSEGMYKCMQNNDSNFFSPPVRIRPRINPQSFSFSHHNVYLTPIIHSCSTRFGLATRAEIFWL